MRSYFVLALILLVSVSGAACSPTGGTAPAAAPPAQPPVASQPASQAAPAAPAPPRPASVRWSSIVNASQSYIPALIQEQGIGRKYGIDVQL